MCSPLFPGILGVRSEEEILVFGEGYLAFPQKTKERKDRVWSRFFSDFTWLLPKKSQGKEGHGFESLFIDFVWNFGVLCGAKRFTNQRALLEKEKGLSHTEGSAILQVLCTGHVQFAVQDFQPYRRALTTHTPLIKVRESFCESGEGVRLPGETFKGADLWGSPGNLRGSSWNFRGSLGNFRGTPGLLLSSTVRELPGKSPKNFRGSWGNFRGSPGTSQKLGGA